MFMYVTTSDEDAVPSFEYPDLYHDGMSNPSPYTTVAASDDLDRVSSLVRLGTDITLCKL